MKFFLIMALVFVKSAQGALPYEWDKDIGNNRFERGVNDQRRLTDIKGHDIFRLAKTCQDNEILITGGCSSSYGMTISGSLPFTSRRKGSKTEWVCMGEPNFRTALTLEGSYPTPETSRENLVGDLEVIIICEKIK